MSFSTTIERKKTDAERLRKMMPHSSGRQATKSSKDKSRDAFRRSAHSTSATKVTPAQAHASPSGATRSANMQQPTEPAISSPRHSVPTPTTFSPSFSSPPSGRVYAKMPKPRQPPKVVFAQPEAQQAGNWNKAQPNAFLQPSNGEEQTDKGVFYQRPHSSGLSGLNQVVVEPFVQAGPQTPKGEQQSDSSIQDSEMAFEDFPTQTQPQPQPFRFGVESRQQFTHPTVPPFSGQSFKNASVLRPSTSLPAQHTLVQFIPRKRGPDTTTADCTHVAYWERLRKQSQLRQMQISKPLSFLLNGQQNPISDPAIKRESDVRQERLSPTKRSREDDEEVTTPGPPKKRKRVEFNSVDEICFYDVKEGGIYGVQSLKRHREELEKSEPLIRGSVCNTPYSILKRPSKRARVEPVVVVALNKEPTFELEFAAADESNKYALFGASDIRKMQGLEEDRPVRPVVPPWFDCPYHRVLPVSESLRKKEIERERRRKARSKASRMCSSLASLGRFFVRKFKP